MIESIPKKENIKDIIDIYEAYLNLNNKINNYNKNIKKCNLKTKQCRRANFPETISEFITYTSLCKKGLKISNKVTSGDLYEIIDGKKLKIEVKCFSSDGPTTFGPKENWNKICFVDMTKIGKFKVFMCSSSNDDKVWRDMKFNRGQTYYDLCNQGKRPHKKFYEIENHLKNQNKPLEVVSEGDIIDCLMDGLNIID